MTAITFTKIAEGPLGWTGYKFVMGTAELTDAYTHDASGEFATIVGVHVILTEDVDTYNHATFSGTDITFRIASGTPTALIIIYGTAVKI